MTVEVGSGIVGDGVIRVIVGAGDSELVGAEVVGVDVYENQHHPVGNIKTCTNMRKCHLTASQISSYHHVII